MNTLYGIDCLAKLGRGELRKPGDYSDQPGQGIQPMLRDEYAERESGVRYDCEAGAEPVI